MKSVGLQHPNKKIKQEARKLRFKGDYDIPTVSNTLRRGKTGRSA